ncbi:DNA repair protein RecO [Bacillus alkalicellulosilyticus]|uniref:DNA repair protein RecO n=1 Tax=Alkalihalobacterium alkalicellulosilyticum TaxID=1912214 RepID=UPI00099891FE|nr:DNA repair protein RecO [Bacillus alkalicellulosilyticus]
MLTTAEGIVIRTIDYGESNKIITLFTKEYGKIGIMARGAKKPKSRVSAVSQLLVYGSFLFYQSSGLGTLQQGEIIESFREVRNDLFRASYASYVVELTDKLMDERQPNQALFALLCQTLRLLNNDVDGEILMRIFEMKMLSVAGISPQLDCCSNCGNVEGEFAFSIQEAGFLCHRCYSKDRHVIKISARAAKLLRQFYYIDLHRLGTISVKKETKQELGLVISAYYDQYSGITLKSKRFLEQLERMDPTDES